MRGVLTFRPPAARVDDFGAGDPASFLPRTRSAAAFRRAPTPFLAAGFSAAASVLSTSALGSYSLPTSSICATSALSPRR